MALKPGFLVSVCAASLLVSLGASFAPQNAFAQKSEILSSQGTWVVRSVQNAGQDKAPYCALAKRFSRKSVLTVAQNANREASIAVDFGRIVLNPKKKIDIVLDPGAGQMREQKITPTSGRAFILRLGQDDSFFGAVRRTGNLRIETGARAYTFDMSDVDGGLKKLDACVEKFVVSDAQGARIRELEAQTTEVSALKKQFGEKIDVLEEQIAALSEQKRAGRTTVSKDMDIPLVASAPVAAVDRAALPSLNAAAPPLSPPASFVGQDIEDVLKTLRSEKAALQNTLQKRAQSLVQRSEEGLRELQSIRSETQKMQAEKMAMQKRLEELETQNSQLAMQAAADSKLAAEERVKAIAEAEEKALETARLNAEAKKNAEAEALRLEELAVQQRLEELEVQNNKLAMQAEADSKLAAEKRADAEAKTLKTEKLIAGTKKGAGKNTEPLNLSMPPADFLKRPVTGIEPLLEVRMPVQQAEAQSDSLNKSERLARSRETLNSIQAMGDGQAFKVEEYAESKRMASVSERYEPAKNQSAVEATAVDVATVAAQSVAVQSAPIKPVATKPSKPIDNFFDEPVSTPKPSVVPKENLAAYRSKPVENALDLSRAISVQDALKSSSSSSSSSVPTAPKRVVEDTPAPKPQPSILQAKNLVKNKPAPVPVVPVRTKDVVKSSVKDVASKVPYKPVGPSVLQAKSLVKNSPVYKPTPVAPAVPVQASDVLASLSPVLPSLGSDPAPAPARSVPVASVYVPPMPSPSMAPPVNRTVVKSVVSDVLKKASVIQNETRLSVVKQDAAKGFTAYEWRAGNVFGSAEERRMASQDDFENQALAYLEKTQNRCKGDFAIIPADSFDIGSRRVDSYEIACIGSGVDASATLIFTHIKGNFVAVAHEAPTEALAEAMDLRDKVIRALRAG
jgi:hypothetical protein